MTFHYQVYGLHLASDRELPELLPATNEAPIDIDIRQAALSTDLPAAHHVDDYQQIAPGVYQFQIPGVARYRVEAGQRIGIDPHPDAEPGNVRLWILGTALGALLHQRGSLPLHASALALNGQAFAFCGDSGAGKSTLAAALHRRGLPLLSDDVGLVVPVSGEVLFHSGFPRIKLWRNALAHFALDPESLIRDHTRHDKFHLTLSDTFEARPHPLKHLYVLDRSDDDQVHFRPIVGHEAIGIIRDSTYRPELIHPLGKAGDHLRQCGRVAQGIRVFRFSRPFYLERLEDSLDKLLGHMASEEP
jgi:hypothetical protein